MIYKWAEAPEDESGSGATNPLDRIRALMTATRDLRIAQWVCQAAGGFFIKNPESGHVGPDHLMPATNAIIQDFADLLAVIAAAAGDNHVSRPEAIKIRARWEELKTVTEGFVRCCEDGDFASLREPPGPRMPP